MASRPFTGPESVTSTASSVKSAAKADASLLFHASSNYLASSRSFCRSCGSGAFVCCAKVGKAKLIANPSRAIIKRFFICFIPGGRMIRRMTQSPIALLSYQKAIANGNRERQSLKTIPRFKENRSQNRGTSERRFFHNVAEIATIFFSSCFGGKAQKAFPGSKPLISEPGKSEFCQFVEKRFFQTAAGRAIVCTEMHTGNQFELPR
jgi:hypothetical protein